MLRTHHCGELRKSDVGKEVTLCGWVDTRRDHGGLIFIDVRDRWGVTQIVFNPAVSKELHAKAEQLRSEFVVQARGKVTDRPSGTENPKLPTGQIEVVAGELEILNTSPTPPFEISGTEALSEEIRLKYRFLDIRRPAMMKNLVTRHKVTQIAREYFNGLQFIEVETPYLTKSTPEGARDFLVPARLSPGEFYALPQSPQLFKQILMVSGIDRYFQIVRCFRDEDLRADRQLEHTQIDVEMSFVNEEDILGVIENLIAKVVKGILGLEVKTPFLRMPYEEAMNRYGSDKPDLRFGMELNDITGILKGSQSKIFEESFAKGGVAKGILVPGAASFSRKDLDDLTQYAKDFGAQGLAWFKVQDAVDSPIRKFFSDEQMNRLTGELGAEKGGLILVVTGDWKMVCTVLGAVRLHLAQKLNLIARDKVSFHWVVDFPLFEWNDEEKRIQACHHPFTSPQPRDLHLLESEPLKVHARAYDLIFNGTEAGGGSIRIHSRDVQKKVFGILGIEDKDAEEKFGFLLKALEFGAPPHGGIALGLDRLTALLLGLDSIRDVIAFPKTQKGICPLSQAPSPVSARQIKELHLTLKA
ncbi:MAG: aspartate--tRNA ligase [Omnitrophica bacterium GWA2_50_21]|nr:MAG: aspartate--tRNA ligase [Omnitrophica bacterium GWA2_50_21]